MNPLTLPFKNLFRRPLRSFLTAVGICIAVAGFVVLVSMSRGIETAWVNSAQSRGIHMFGVSRDAVEMLTGSFDEGLCREIAEVDGVGAVASELIDLVRMDDLKGDAQIIVRGWPANAFIWNTLRLESGTIPQSTQDNSVVVGSVLAGLLKTAPGKTIRLRKRILTVSGVAAPAGIMNDMCLILPLATLQNLLGRRGKVNEFCLRLVHPEDPASVNDVKRRLQGRFEKLAFHTTQEIAQNNGILRIFRTMTWGISLVAMIMAGILVLNTLLITVTERTREIGLLAAVGWNPTRILLLILAEGIILTAVGAVAGITLGVPALHWLLQVPSLRGLFEPAVSQQLALDVLLASLFVGACGSLYPAWRATRLSPADALRSE